MKRLTQLRESQGLTRTRLGAIASVGPARVGQMELGRLAPPFRSVELVRLAEALDWPVERAGELLEEVPEP